MSPIRYGKNYPLKCEDIDALFNDMVGQYSFNCNRTNQLYLNCTRFEH